MSSRVRNRALIGSAILTVVVSVGVAVLLATTSGSAVASVGQIPAVPSALLSVLNAHGVAFTAAPASATAEVGASQAMNDAVAAAPWPGTATGASLMQTTALSQPQSPGSLVWLVNINPTTQVGPAGGGPASPGGGSASSSRPAANYFVVVIDASDGHFIEAEDGFDSSLSSVSASRDARHSHGRATTIKICGQKMPYHRGPKPAYALSPHRTYMQHVAHSTSVLTVVARRCEAGSDISVQPQGVASIVARAYAHHHGGLVAIAVRARKVGKALLTVRQHGKLLGRVRYVVTQRGLHH